MAEEHASSRAPDPVILEIQQGLGSVVRRIPDLQRRVMWRAGVGLDRAATTVLDVVAASGPMRPSAVAEALMVDLSYVSRQVQRLLEAGFLRREPDPADGRAFLVEATPSGREALARVSAAWYEVLEGAFASWPRRDLERFRILVGRYAADLERMAEGS